MAKCTRCRGRGYFLYLENDGTDHPRNGLNKIRCRECKGSGVLDDSDPQPAHHADAEPDC